MKPALILAIVAVSLSAPIASSGPREDFRLCMEAHLQEFIDEPFTAEQLSVQVVDLHCDIEAIEFAWILAEAQSGRIRDEASFIGQIDLLRGAVSAEVARRRGH